MGMNDAAGVADLLGAAGDSIRAMYVAGSFLPQHLARREDVLGKLDFLVVQELFETDTTAFADVVFPAASFAEVDGTFTNNDGFVQRVRKSIEPVHQSLPDWVIAARLAKELGIDFGYERSATAVFREISERVAGYGGIRYPDLKDESKPVQVKHAIARQRDLSSDVEMLRRSVEAMSEARTKITGAPSGGHGRFKPGTLTSRA